MNSSKTKVKTIVQGVLVGAGLLMATSVFADNHGRGRDFDDHRGHEWQHRDFDHGRGDDRHHDFGHHFGYYNHGHEWHDRDYDRGGVRFVLPSPRVFIPVPRPPHVIFSFGAPVRTFITNARVLNVDPIINRSYDDSYDRAERCDGYRVTYEFRGQEYTTVMSYDPGETIRIKVGRDIEVLG